MDSVGFIVLRPYEVGPFLEECIGRGCPLVPRLKALVNNRITGLVWKSSERISLSQAICLRNIDGQALAGGVDWGGGP